MRRTIFWAAIAIFASLKGSVVAQVPEIIDITNPPQAVTLTLEEPGIIKQVPEIINITNPPQAVTPALEQLGIIKLGVAAAAGANETVTRPSTIKLRHPDSPRPSEGDSFPSIWNQLPAVANDETAVNPRLLTAANVPDKVVLNQKPPLTDAADDTVIQINTARPAAAELFRLETEKQFRARLMKETERWRDRVHIPEFPETSAKLLPRERGWPLALENAESGRLCFFRLGFAQPRSERYGRTIGPLQPFLSAGLFYGDLATLPARALVPPWTIEQCDDLSDLSSVPWRGR
jgi:hypothetical protein